MKTTQPLISDPARVLVLGLGRSGAAAAQLLARRGTAVTVLDSGAGTANEDTERELGRLGVHILRYTTTAPSAAYDLCVVSPGIDCRSPMVQGAAYRCGDVISELELGARYCRCPLIAVTGTNGKSTLTKLLHEMLCTAGLRSEPGGNYGTPLSELAARSENLDWIVVEVSSFQLELTCAFHPRIGVLLNFQPDHLGRHGSMAQYRFLKARLFANIGPGDTAFVHEPEFNAVWDAAGGGSGADWLRFGLHAGNDLRYDETAHAVVTGTGPAPPVSIALTGTMFDNPVTGLTAAVAVGCGLRCGLDRGQMQCVLADFKPLEHRMETTAVAGGVQFVNDSKATNLAAVRAALEMTAAPIRLIAGGQLKENDVKSIKEVLKKRVLSVYLIGEAAEFLYKAWSDVVDCRLCGDLEAAVLTAWREAGKGDLILLSPGGASFDQFKSYADRGRRFKEVVSRVVTGEGC